MARRPKSPLSTWPPELAVCIKWARHGGSPNPPAMTPAVALENAYEELIDALNYTAIAVASRDSWPEVEGIRQQLEQMAHTIRLMIHELKNGG